MSIVHGFVLLADKSENEKLKSEMEGFYNASENLRMGIPLHITLMLACLTDERKLQVLDVLKKNIHKFSPLKVRFGRVMAMGDKYLALSFDAPGLMEIHLKLLDLLQPFTEGMFNHKYLKHDLSDKELEYLHRYGYHRVKDFFNPHLTIGKYDSQEIRDRELESVLVPKGSFLFDVFRFDETIEGDFAVNNILWNTKLS